MARADTDAASVAELAAELAAETSRLAAELDGLEFQLMLGGSYDRKNAILALHAGAGGTESQDWTEMLLRMYIRWAERRGFKAEVLDTMPGEEAGIKSVTLAIRGPFAYGYLRSERGVHRLVRLSPYDAAHRRHTSFALAEVMPEADADVEVTVNPEDVKMEVFRSSGAGGQNVQKTSTAVRLIHGPTGIIVTCQDQRSQLQNKETALRILQSRLLALRVEEQETEQARLKGQHVAAGWGNQIRSYVLHPYNMVKDHRTEHETSNTSAVLDGEIDEFVQAFLKQSMGAE
jgi:peptide chain release factor 2